ncbi:MAG: TolC family protein [bacterium]|nr:TolC family protein [bacterium]
MKRTSIYFLLILGSAQMVLAQESLSLKQAYELALKNNYSIQIASNELEIAKRNNTLGNAGMLPSLTGTLTQDNQVIDTKQKFLSGAENNRDGAKSNSLNGNVEMGWTLFNGMKMFATRSKLIEWEALGELRLRQQMEATLSRVAKSYFDVLLAKEQLKSGKEFVQISEKRLEVAKAKLENGKSPKSDMLTALVNLNSDIAAYKRLETQLKNSKLGLNQLLGMQISFVFDVSDALSPDEQLKFEEIKSKAMENNSGIRIAKLNQRVAQFQVKEIRGERYPSLQLRSGYTYSKQESEAGFLQSANTQGLHYGFGVNMNLFNGFDVDRRMTNAKIGFRTSELLLKDSLLKLEVTLAQAYQVYLTNIDLYKFEQSNLDVAKQNFDLAKLQQDQGMISINDLRIAQVNLIQSVVRLQQAAYDAKLSEVELQRLSGSLIQ